MSKPDLGFLMMAWVSRLTSAGSMLGRTAMPTEVVSSVMSAEGTSGLKSIEPVRRMTLVSAGKRLT